MLPRAILLAAIVGSLTASSLPCHPAVDNGRARNSGTVSGTHARRAKRPNLILNPVGRYWGGDPEVNVKNFGAVCDGSTDDTAAIQRAYDAAAAQMSMQGGAGIVYFPPSSGYCKVTTLNIPSMGFGQGWLTSVFDNGLFVLDSVHPGNNNAFIGRTSNFAGLGNVFLWGPTAEWQKPKDAGITEAPVVDLDGVSQVYFEGIAFTSSTDSAPVAVHVHDNNGTGSVNLTFKRCSVIGDFDIDASTPQTVAGFGLHIEDTSMGNLNIQNFGMITIRGGFLHKVTTTNAGIPTAGDMEISDTLAEALTNEDFLTVDTTGGPVSDITLRRVSLADSVGTVYMLTHVNDSGINWVVNAEFDQIPFNQTGTGLIDPASAPSLLSVTCIGSNCDGVLSQAKQTLYMFEGMPPKGPMTVYGSQYVPNPLVVTH
jgi:Pectate lyase superfamily protein